MFVDLCILTSVILWGAWGIFEKKALESSTPKDVAVVLYILNVAFIPLLLSVLQIFEPGWSLSAELIFWSGVSSCGYAIAVVSYLAVLKRVDVSYVIGSTASYPVVAIFLATVFLGEPIVGVRLFGAALVALGVFLIGRTKMSANDNEFSAKTKTFLTFCLVTTTFAFGLRGVVDKLAVSCGTPLTVMFANYLWSIVFGVIVFLIFKKQKHQFHLKNKRANFFCLLSSFCLTIGGLSYLTAMMHCPVSYVVGITSIYPLVMYFLALVFLKEQFSPARLSGISIIVLGALLLQITRSL